MNYTNGFVYVTVVNALVNSASESSTSGIICQVFVSGAEDIQFAQPTLETIWGNGVYAPQLVAPEHPEERRKFTTQMDDNFSSEGLKTRQCQIIGNVEPGHISSNAHMSTDVVSLKQLFNMGGFFDTAGVAVATNAGVEFHLCGGNNMLPRTNAEANRKNIQKNFISYWVIIERVYINLNSYTIRCLIFNKLISSTQSIGM